MGKYLDSGGLSHFMGKIKSWANGAFLKLSGGTMTGTLTLANDRYEDDNATAALNLRNSNIIGVNAIYTNDVSESAQEGINFFADTKHVDSIHARLGELYFTPYRQLGTNGTSAKVYRQREDMAGRPASANSTTRGGSMVHQIIASSSMSTGKPMGDAHILEMEWDNTSNWTAQFAIPTGTNHRPQWRTQSGIATWEGSEWHTLMDDRDGCFGDSLTPFLERKYYKPVTGGYWQKTADQIFHPELFTILENGWCHAAITNWSSNEFAPPRVDWLVPGTKVTMLVEWRNATSTGDGLNSYTRNYANNTQINENWYFGTLMTGESGEVRHVFTVNSTALGTASWNALANVYFTRASSSSTWEGDFRISFYVGDYKGPWKPYTGEWLRPVSGHNLLKYTENPDICGAYSQSLSSLEGWYQWGNGTMEDTGEGIKFTGSGSAAVGVCIPLANKEDIAETCTLSFDYRGTLTSFGDLYKLADSGGNHAASPNFNPIVSESEWQHAEITFLWAALGNGKLCQGLLYPYVKMDGKWIEFRKGSVKLEKGAVATPYSPAPEDMDLSTLKGSLKNKPVYFSGDSLPSFTSPQYFLGIEGFASGGQVKYVTAANAWTALGGGAIGKKNSLAASDIPAHASTATTYGAASTTNYGHAKLSSATNSSSEDLAATPKAVKAAYDLASGASTTAGQALSAATGAKAVKVAYSISNGTVTGEVHVYSAGAEVTTQWPAGAYSWSYEAGAGNWVSLGTGYTKNVPLSTLGYGGNLKCSFDDEVTS